MNNERENFVLEPSHNRTIDLGKTLCINSNNLPQPDLATVDVFWMNQMQELLYHATNPDHCSIFYEHRKQKWNPTIFDWSFSNTASPTNIYEMMSYGIQIGFL